MVPSGSIADLGASTKRPFTQSDMAGGIARNGDYMGHSQVIDRGTVRNHAQQIHRSDTASRGHIHRLLPGNLRDRSRGPNQAGNTGCPTSHSRSDFGRTVCQDDRECVAKRHVRDDLRRLGPLTVRIRSHDALETPPEGLTTKRHVRVLRTSAFSSTGAAEGWQYRDAKAISESAVGRFSFSRARRRYVCTVLKLTSSLTAISAVLRPFDSHCRHSSSQGATFGTCKLTIQAARPDIPVSGQIQTR
jgi:hypothetical protein